MYRKYHGFLPFFTSSSQNKPAKNAGIYNVLMCFDKTTCKKTRCFQTIFHNFSAHAPPFKKRSFFTLFLPPLIRTQEGVKSGRIVKLHLNSTFCLSQSLLQTCNTKNWCRLSGPQNAVNYGVLWTYHAFYLQEKGPRLTVLVPLERHALLHLRCGRILRAGELASFFVFDRSFPGNCFSGWIVAIQSRFEHFQLKRWHCQLCIVDIYFQCWLWH